jgi:deoxycytidylate deaminase
MERPSPLSNMRTARRQAEKASVKGEHKIHRLGAVIAFGNDIVSVGWNKSKTHPKSTHPWKHIHAEMDAIMKAGQCDGAELYVARIGNDGLLRNAKPCPACMSLIIASGIRKIHFTENNDWCTIEL